MSHQDQLSKQAIGTHAADLKAALDWLLTGDVAAKIEFSAVCTWTPYKLIFAAMLWAWGDQAALGERFRAAHKLISWLFERQPAPAKSYQAFINLLCAWTEPLRDCLQAAFRLQTESALAAYWTIHGWLVFACDGSRVNVPRTRHNEARYSPRSKLSRAAQKRRRVHRRRKAEQRKREQRERKANVPRIWLTTLWHVGAGLPWNWRIGPSDSGEREHLVSMLASLPTGALLTADAGFVGYELWQLIAAAKLEMLVRVGGNVRLLRKLGYVRERDGLVYLWPNKAARKRLRPLVLRLIVAQGERQPVYLVTSVIEPRRLSDRAAADIYGRRWGIELFYRSYKQTFDRHKLRSHNADNAAVEMEWSLLGMWAMGLYSHHRLTSQGIAPEKISFAGVLRAYRRPLREYRCRPEPGERLLELLDVAIIDDYERKSKASRDYPQKKPDRQAAGPPRILKATTAQIALAKQLRGHDSKIRLTA
jgi:Transposase DDE domain